MCDLLNLWTMFHRSSALIAGSHVLRAIKLAKEMEIAAVERKSVVVTVNSESFLIRLSSPEGTLVDVIWFCSSS